MRRVLGSLVLLLTLTGSTLAANLRIVGTEAVWDSPAALSPTYYVMIVNEQGATDRLSAWQLLVSIVATEDSTGEVRFASADLPRDPVEDYLLAGDSGVLGWLEPPPSPLITEPADSMMLGDYAQSGVGEVVPASLRTLLKMTLLASEDAHGVFSVVVVPGSDNSFWMSSDTNDFLEPVRGFANVPLEGNPVVIGTISVGMAIPEPGTAFLLTSAAMTMLLLWASTRRLARQTD